MDARRDLDHEEFVEEIWQQQLSSFDQGRLTPAEEFLAQYTELQSSQELLLDVVLNEYELIIRSGQAADCQIDLLRRFPKIRAQLEKQFRLWDAFKIHENQSVDIFSGLVQPTNTERSLDSRFSDRRTIGRGATAVVETAFDQTLQQKVALKRLLKHLHKSDRARQRFYREAHAVSRLHHPNIVPIFEIIEQEDEVVLVSRLVKGMSLRDLVNQKPSFSLENVVDWTYQIAESLHYAHENGVIHRDIKPSNILIDEDNKAMLIDFGLASVDDEMNADITATGDLIGTPAFMSPEQAIGDWKQIDARTDVYSTGATLYWLLTGYPPFEGSISNVVKSVIDSEPAPFTSHLIHERHDLKTIIDKCMRKSPNERYHTSRELADDLRRLQMGEMLSAKRSTRFNKIVKHISRRPAFFAFMTITVLLSMFLLGSLLQLNQVRTQRNRARDAEATNQQLLMSASMDAGRLAMRQGNLDQAIRHFEMGVAQETDHDAMVRLLLVECLFSIGQFDKAAKWLEEARQLSLNAKEDALVNYWDYEFTIIGHPNYRYPSSKHWISELSPSKQLFLEGLNAETSEDALNCFRDSFIDDPYHHSARKMYLVMALSMAQLDDAKNESRLAQQLYPQDIDFLLIEATAVAATEGFDSAEFIVNKIADLDQSEEDDWIRFLKFVSTISKPIADQDFFDTQRLSWFSNTLDIFLDEHLQRFQKRGWRFPTIIGEHFLELCEERDAGTSLIGLKDNLVELVDIHPEGTLLTILAESELAGVHSDNIDQLERARNFFQRATQRNALLRTASESAWFGLYTTAMTLDVVHKKDREENQKLMLLAADQIEPAWLRHEGNARGMVIPLFNMHQWKRVRPIIDRWVELAESDREIEEAYWHLAVWHRYQENWIAVKRICEKMKTLLPKEMKPRFSWSGLENRALQEIQSIIQPNNQ